MFVCKILCSTFQKKNCITATRVEQFFGSTYWNLIQEGYFEYGNFEFENGNFEFENGNFEEESVELKTKWGTKSKVGN